MDFLPISILASHTIRILFVGNSLLNFNNVPDTVAKLLESGENGKKVVSKSFFVGHLEDVKPSSEVDREVGSGNYDFVVLQAAMVSSSMSRTYPQSRAIAMARLAKSKHARVLLYVEWPRKGIDETQYTMNVYRGMAKASGAEIVPVCFAWNAVHGESPKSELWMPDGNHATVLGSFVAATSVFVRIGGTEKSPTYRPTGVDAAFAKLVLEQCRLVELGRHRMFPAPKKGEN